jgi:hypothetical protein
VDIRNNRQAVQAGHGYELLERAPITATAILRLSTRGR